jgi:hypothetical protein
MADDFKLEQRGSASAFAEDAAKRLRGAIDTNMLQAAVIAAGSVRQAVYDEFKPGTNLLAWSFKPTLLADGEDGSLRSGALSDVIYARIQDEGGTIVPKRAKALAIPVSPRAKGGKGGSIGPGDFPKNYLHMVWPKGGPKGFLFGLDSVLHFVLQKSVTLKATGYLEQAARIAFPLITEDMELAIQKGLDETKAGGE